MQRRILVKEATWFHRGLMVGNDEYIHRPKDEVIPAKIEELLWFVVICAFLILPFWII